jgi:predicted small metal-binding protein
VKRFNCGDLIPGCQATYEAASDDEIVEKVRHHARRDHGFDDIPEGREPMIRAKITALDG